MIRKFFRTIAYANLFLYMIVLFISFSLMYKKYRNPGEFPTIFDLAPITSCSNIEGTKSGDLLILRKYDKSKGESSNIASVMNLDKEEYLDDQKHVVETYVVNGEEITGKIILNIPYAGYMVEFVKSTVGIILFIVIPVIILVGGEIKYFLLDRNRQ